MCEGERERVGMIRRKREDEEEEWWCDREQIVGCAHY